MMMIMMMVNRFGKDSAMEFKCVKVLSDGSLSSH